MLRKLTGPVAGSNASERSGRTGPRIHSMNRIGFLRGLGLALTALVWAVVPSQTLAQDDEPNWLNVRVIEVKPDRTGEWETLQKEMSAAMQKAGSARSIWKVANGDVDVYHIVTMVPKMGEADQPGENPLGATRFAQWAAQVAQCVGRRQVLTLRNRPELSVPAKEGREPKLLMLSMRTVVPAKVRDYAGYLRDDYLPALKKSKRDGVYVHQVFAGGSPDTWVVASWIDSWGAFDTPHPVVTALGQDEARAIFDKGRSMVEGRERVVLSYRADLSAQP